MTANEPVAQYVAIGSSADVTMTAIVEMDCENCPTVLRPGDECQIAGPGDIRLVCIPCFHALNG